MFHHVREIHLVHGGHAAARMPGSEVTPQQVELFRSGPRFASRDDKIAIAAQIAALRGRGRNAPPPPAPKRRPAIGATGPIGHRLAAAETDPAQCVVQVLGPGPLSSVNTFRSCRPGR
jgi:hypothetical protein